MRDVSGAVTKTDGRYVCACVCVVWTVKIGSSVVQETRQCIVSEKETDTTF